MSIDRDRVRRASRGTTPDDPFAPSPAQTEKELATEDFRDPGSRASEFSIQEPPSSKSKSSTDQDARSLLKPYSFTLSPEMAKYLDRLAALVQIETGVRVSRSAIVRGLVDGFRRKGDLPDLVSMLRASGEI
jgi:hypothetical protein